MQHKFYNRVQQKLPQPFSKFQGRQGKVARRDVTSSKTSFNFILTSRGFTGAINVMVKFVTLCRFPNDAVRQLCSYQLQF